MKGFRGLLLVGWSRILKDYCLVGLDYWREESQLEGDGYELLVRWGLWQKGRRRWLGRDYEMRGSSLGVELDEEGREVLEWYPCWLAPRGGLQNDMPTMPLAVLETQQKPKEKGKAPCWVALRCKTGL